MRTVKFNIHRDIRNMQILKLSSNVCWIVWRRLGIGLSVWFLIFGVRLRTQCKYMGVVSMDILMLIELWYIDSDLYIDIFLIRAGRFNDSFLLLHLFKTYVQSNPPLKEQVPKASCSYRLLIVQDKFGRQ